MQTRWSQPILQPMQQHGAPLKKTPRPESTKRGAQKPDADKPATKRREREVEEAR